MCFYKWKFDCDGRSYDLIKAGPVRITKVIKCSKVYEDNMHFDLEKMLKENSDLTIDCHKGCVSTYTSNMHLNRHKNASPPRMMWKRQLNR